jgi:hypothetical protein
LFVSINLASPTVCGAAAPLLVLHALLPEAPGFSLQPIADGFADLHDPHELALLILELTSISCCILCSAHARQSTNSAAHVQGASLEASTQR